MSGSKSAYSKEEETLLRHLYLDDKIPLEEIAEQMGKSIPSIRSKLVRDGVYHKIVRIKQKKTGPGIKELVRDIEGITGLHFDALARANKSDLIHLVGWLKEHENNGKS